jgi:hypothetical protein
LLNKILNFLRYFWASVFLGGAALNLVLTIASPEGYAKAVLFAWPPSLQGFWDSTVAPNIRLFLAAFVVIEVVLGLMLINQGRYVKYGAAGACIFGAGLLFLGPGAIAGQEVVARVPNLVFEAMMLALLLGRYEKTLWETLRLRKRLPVKTNVIGG